MLTADASGLKSAQQQLLVSERAVLDVLQGRRASHRMTSVHTGQHRQKTFKLLRALDNMAWRSVGRHLSAWSMDFGLSDSKLIDQFGNPFEWRHLWLVGDQGPVNVCAKWFCERPEVLSLLVTFAYDLYHGIWNDNTTAFGSAKLRAHAHLMGLAYSINFKGFDEYFGRQCGRQW